MHSFFFFWISFVLLLLGNLFPVAAVVDVECSPAVSDPIQATLDNGTLFSTCAVDDAGVKIRVNSLFDVLEFSERDFLIFCRTPSCIRPVQKLLQAIPTDCLIPYHGSTHNLSEEVMTLYMECAETVEEADLADEDDMYRYFLDYQS